MEGESSDPRAVAIARVLAAAGWPEGGFQVLRDGPDLGDWYTYMAFTTNPSGTLVDAWAGPRAPDDPTQLIVAGQPLTRPRLRALLASPGVAPKDVAHVISRTSGVAHELGDPLPGDPMGVPVRLEAQLHAPRTEGEAQETVFAYFARTFAGVYVRVRARLDGSGPVELTIDPPQGPAVKVS